MTQTTEESTKLLTPIEAFVKHVELHPKKIFLRQPLCGDIIEYSYEDAFFEIGCMASRLSELPKDSHIAILSLNCAHWILADLAIMLAGHVSVPIYPTANTSTVAQILEHSECCLLFVGKMLNWESNHSLVPGTIETISMHYEHEGMESWSGITRRYQPLEDYQFPALESMASIIYTSGTTGMPKGVMTSYATFANGGDIVTNFVHLDSQERFFSYLPLAHVAERNAVEMAAIYTGAVITFLDSLETFTRDLVEAKVTIFLGVPRIWIKTQQAIQAKIPSLVFKILTHTPFVNRWFKNKLRSELGMNNLKIALSGAAALPLKTLHWFEELGITICEVYGMTESFGISNFNHPEQRLSGSVGRAMPNTTVVIAESGEITYSNDCLMMGYYKDPELTLQTIKDDFLYTGDTGKIEDGYLWITGRVKDIFKTSKGKYISPVKIEMELEPRANLEQLCVLGSSLAQPVVVGVVSSKPEQSQLKDYEERLERIMVEVNSRLEKSEKLIKWFLVDEPWTTENDMITPTLKLRRQSIEKKYMEQIESQIDNKKKVIWL